MDCDGLSWGVDSVPIMLTMMLVNLCIGIVTRAAPALNIFAVGFPAMVLAGMVLFLVYW